MSLTVLSLSGNNLIITGIGEFGQWSITFFTVCRNLRACSFSNFGVQVRLYLPPDFSETKKYALVINVYGGPNSQQVKLASGGYKLRVKK